MSVERVSAIVPVRDGELYIAEALESILAQTRPPDQVIVVDDGSEDGTRAIAEGFGPPIACISREPGGVGAAVNTGLEAADGDLISMLDADDLWTPRKLELQRAVLDRNPAVDVVFGHVEEFVSPELSEGERARLRAAPKSAAAKLKGTMLARREAVDRVGAFATSLKVSDFIDWYGRAMDHGLREEMVPEVILRRRLHRANIGRQHPEARVEYAQVVAERLRRRRAQS